MLVHPKWPDRILSILYYQIYDPFHWCNRIHRLTVKTTSLNLHVACCYCSSALLYGKIPLQSFHHICLFYTQCSGISYYITILMIFEKTVKSELNVDGTSGNPYINSFTNSTSISHFWVTKCRRDVGRVPLCMWSNDILFLVTFFKRGCICQYPHCIEIKQLVTSQV